MNKKKSSLIIILIAILLSVIAGLYIKENTLIFFIIDLISRLFINFLLFLLIPLICSSIISSIIKLKKEKQKKGLVLRIFGFFILTNFAAIIVGFFITLLYPTFFKFSFANSYSIDLSSFKMLGDIVIQIIPNNIIYAFANNQMLGVIFFSIIFGYVSTKIKDEFSDVLFKIFDSIFHAMLEIANIVIKVLPLGIFCLLVKHIATIGYSDLYNFIILMGLVLIALFFYCFVILFIFFKIFVKFKFFSHLKKIMPAIIVGFFTTSSASTLSVLMKCLKNKNKN